MIADPPDLPLPGTTAEDDGTRFALFSRDAERIELCLFDSTGRREESRHTLRERIGDLWHDHFPVGPGQLYGYRVYGPYQPEKGLRFNPNKLLIDPYARLLAGAFDWNDAVFGYIRGHPDGDLSFDTRDSAPFVPKCVVPERARRPDDPASTRPCRASAATIIYEMHLKGLTRRHPDLPREIRGTPDGLASAEMIGHLTRLGITAVELLPVQASADELHLARRGYRNYWGYNPLAYFAADRRLGLGSARDLAPVVRSLHDAGIEVILDVVFNHTAEGNEEGPTLSFRGIDNRAYYLLEPDAPRWYVNFSGCGNTLKAGDPMAARLIVDALRYWAEATDADGFRFDLAGTLKRGADGREDGNYLMGAIMTDPLLSQLKLIAEPWDASGEGYRLGGFPAGWSEWNDRYRDAVRRFWSGHGGIAGELATRLSGSADIFAPRHRQPSASVNLITCHDGFTLQDLVSYRQKHNHQNGEQNRDGENNNYSVNCGIEGPTDDPAVSSLRLREKRNRLATLLLSRGMPMLLAGDEIGNGQSGNNNVYCQDNELGWVDWSGRGDPQTDLTGFIARLVELRRSLPILTEDRYRDEETVIGDEGHGDSTGYRLRWLTPSGRDMTPGDWQFHDAHVLICEIAAVAAKTRCLIAMNALDSAISCRLPGSPEQRWHQCLDTAAETGFPDGRRHDGGSDIRIDARATVLFLSGGDAESISGDQAPPASRPG